MKISGFSFARNAVKYGYPIAESIRSVLPICDEFVIAVGSGDEDDTTLETIQSIGDPKIIIIKTVWKEIERLKGAIYSQQTNLALEACTGDWCFYIQADEVVHEKFLDEVVTQCERHGDNFAVEGFLFNYRHFWGDYDHYLLNHKWYPREIRIVRNRCGVQSIGDAQSFRNGGRKLRVIQLDAEIFHYGYVRNPTLMQKRTAAITKTYQGNTGLLVEKDNEEKSFNYGSLEQIPLYTGTYPKVMQERIAAMNWKDMLQYKGRSRIVHDHDRLRNRILTFLEQKIFRGKHPWGYRNYVLVR